MPHPMSEAWLDWRPMESAPRDGRTWVILFCGQAQEPYDVARWNYDGDCWSTAGGKEWAELQPFGPTCWAAIPEPPYNLKLTSG